MKLQLCYSPIACSMVPYINLTEAAADFEVLPVNMGKGQHNSPEYLRINPKHKVPVLVIDGEPLTENVAINVWIARNFPEANLLPKDPMKSRRFRCWPGVPRAFTRDLLRITTRSASAMCQALRRASNNARRSCSMRTSPSLTICSRDGSGSLITTRPSMRTFSGRSFVRSGLISSILI